VNVEVNSIQYGLSDCGLCTQTDTPTVVDWYMVLAKHQKYQK